MHKVALRLMKLRALNAGPRPAASGNALGAPSWSREKRDREEAHPIDPSVKLKRARCVGFRLRFRHLLVPDACCECIRSLPGPPCSPCTSY